MDIGTKLQFNTITLLRYPLIVGVVLLHCYTADPAVNNAHPVFSGIQYVFSVLLGNTAVPLFFFISGFLFFNNIHRWDAKIYADKLKKRARSLALPYFFWITLCIALYFTAQQLPFLARYFAGEQLIQNYTPGDFLRCYWAVPATNMPFLYPFWFIRDLMVAVLLSPLIFYFVKYLRLYGIALLCAAWMFAPWQLPGLSPACLFFFTAGAYLSINNLNIITVFSSVHYLGWLYPVIAIANMVFRTSEWNAWLHAPRIMAGIIFFFIVGSKLVQKGIKLPVMITNASFFVFAAHEPWLSLCRRLGYAIVKPGSGVGYIALYFGCAALTVTAALIAYKILLALLPRLLNAISGGR